MSDWDTPVAAVLDAWDDAPAPLADVPTEADDGDVIFLAPNANARDIHEALLAAPDPTRVLIDAASVERLPGPLLQVLLAAMRDAQMQGQRLTVRNPSFAFSLAFEAYGLGSENEPFNVEYS